MVQEGRKPAGLVLGEDRTGSVLEKTVDHYPVEAGERSDLMGGGVAQPLQVARGGEGGGGGADRGENVGGSGPVQRCRLQLQHEGAVALVGEDVEGSAAGRRYGRAEVDRLPSRTWWQAANRVAGVDPEDLGDGPVE